MEIQAGPHPRVHCPISAPAAAAAGARAAVQARVLVRIAGGEHEEHKMALQRDGDRLWFVLPYLGPDQVARLEVRPGGEYRGRGVR